MTDKLDAIPGSTGRKIIDGLKDAAAGNFSSVWIEGQRWVRADAPAASEPVVGPEFRVVPLWAVKDAEAFIRAHHEGKAPLLPIGLANFFASLIAQPPVHSSDAGERIHALAIDLTLKGWCAAENEINRITKEAERKLLDFACDEIKRHMDRAAPVPQSAATTDVPVADDTPARVYVVYGANDYEDEYRSPDAAFATEKAAKEWVERNPAKDRFVPTIEAFDLSDAVRSTATSAEPVAWCQPMDCGKHTPRKFMIYFEDPDHGIMVFDNEAEARAAFERKNTAWNCYLFGSLPLYATPPSSGNADAVRDFEPLAVDPDEQRMFDEACKRLGWSPLEKVASELHFEHQMAPSYGSYRNLKAIAYNVVMRAALSRAPVAGEWQKALKPLAGLYEQIDDRDADPDTDVFFQHDGTKITFGDIRRARALLSRNDREGGAS